jgi:hypothetical protein
LGVKVQESQVTVVLQPPADSLAAEQDMTDLVSELAVLLGPNVAVSRRVDIDEESRLSPHPRGNSGRDAQSDARMFPRRPSERA